MNANELADKLNQGHWEGGTREQAATMLCKQQEEIEYWKDKFNKAMELQEPKPAKYSDAWWKEVEEFNKKAQAK